MNPGTIILLTVEALIFGYTVCSIFVGIGHLREYRQRERERRQREPRA